MQLYRCKHFLKYQRKAYIYNKVEDYSNIALLNNEGAGANLSVVVFSSQYQKTDGNTNVSLRLYSHPQISAVGYDATLQGGILGGSLHTFSGNKIERVIYSHSYGVNLQINKLYLEYFYQTRTKNFKQGKAHSWGGIAIGLII